VISLAQRFHDICGQSGVGEHSALASDEREISGWNGFFEPLNKEVSHIINAVAHLVKLADPQRSQLWICENDSD
jgi:hypothetical protein